jgi:hypothetical protein
LSTKCPWLKFGFILLSPLVLDKIFNVKEQYQNAGFWKTILTMVIIIGLLVVIVILFFQLQIEQSKVF